jgi:hypothetical protein
MVKSSKFTVKYVYEHLTKRDEGISYSRVWRAKLPEKIKVFMWLVEQRSILTKDNMKKRNRQGDPDCYFCGQFEDTDHLLLVCPISKVIWGVIAMCFHQNDMPSSYDQFWPWLEKSLPGGQDVYMVGLAAIC